MTSQYEDLGLMIDSRIPLIVIESHEEPAVLEMIGRLAISRNLRLLTWSITDGLRLLGFGTAPPEGAASPEQVLRYIKASADPGLFVLCDFHPYLQDAPVIIRLLREIAMHYAEQRHTLLLLSHRLDLPPELKRYSARLELSMPTEEQLMSIVREEANRWSQANRGRPVRSDNATFRKLVMNLKGLPAMDVRRLVRGVIYEDGAIVADDLPEVSRAKFELMDMGGVLSFEYNTTAMAEVGGLNNLKRWLELRRDAFLRTEDTASDFPRGLLLLGIQGSGKSLAAKAVAGAWGLPLLRLDFGTLYNKYHGETERNLRNALQQADIMAPCVLWLDEIEKGISLRDNDDGLSRRILGTLLTWMAERTRRVFLVATSNAIHALPPELIRKGRIDEIFFVDLPDAATRQDIFRIHIERRGVASDDFDLCRLAAATEGFSGAEIEQVVVAARYSAESGAAELRMDHLLEAVEGTSPLSVVMAEQVESLRAWAAGRTVNAN